MYEFIRNTKKSVFNYFMDGAPSGAAFSPRYLYLPKILPWLILLGGISFYLLIIAIIIR